MRDSFYVYGAGNMGIATVHMLRKMKCEITGIIDGNPKLRGELLCGIIVQTAEDISLEVRKKAIVVIAMSAVPFFEIKSYLEGLGYEHIVPAGDCIEKITGKPIINVWKLTEQEAEEALKLTNDMFADEKSEREFKYAVGWFKARDERSNSVIKPIDRKKYFPEFICKILDREATMLDLALLDGSYVKEFAKLIKDYKYIYAYKLTPASMTIEEEKELQNQIERFEILSLEAGEEDGDVRCQRFGIMQPFSDNREVICQKGKIDTWKFGKKISYIRAYSMDPILPILQSGKNTICSDRPIIAMNVSHFKRDFLAFSQELKTICDEYTFLFRMHSYHGNDCIVYAIPNEKWTLNTNGDIL